MTDSTQSDGRQAGEFTEEESRIHQAGFKILHQGLTSGLDFEEACRGLEVVDPEMRRIVIDDYLKVTVAEEHFQRKRPLEDVADGLRCPVEKLEIAREEMVKEVQKASADVFRQQSDETGFTMDDIPEEPEDTNNN